MHLLEIKSSNCRAFDADLALLKFELNKIKFDLNFNLHFRACDAYLALLALPFNTSPVFSSFKVTNLCI